MFSGMPDILKSRGGRPTIWDIGPDGSPDWHIGRPSAGKSRDRPDKKRQLGVPNRKGTGSRHSAGNAPHDLTHPFDMGHRHVRVNRQRQHFLAGCLGDRQTSRPVIQMTVDILEMKTLRVAQ